MSRGKKIKKFSLVPRASTSKFLLVLLPNNLSMSRKNILALSFLLVRRTLGENICLSCLKFNLSRAPGQVIFLPPDETGYTFSFLEHLVPHSHWILTSVHISLFGISSKLMYVNLNHYYNVIGSTSYNVKLVRLENKQKWRKAWRLKECTMIMWVECQVS